MMTRRNVDLVRVASGGPLWAHHMAIVLALQYAGLKDESAFAQRSIAQNLGGWGDT